MLTCLTLNNMAFPIKLEQSGRDRFRVTYGAQVRSGMDYAEAAAELGTCVMHALACDGRLNNPER